MASKPIHRVWPRFTLWHLVKFLIGGVLKLIIVWPVYFFLFYIWWPRRSKALARYRFKRDMFGQRVCTYDPYKSIAWEFFRKRARALNRRKYGVLTCVDEECLSSRKRVYHVHHIRWRSHAPDLFLWLPNLEVRCEACHQKVHDHAFT